MMPVTALMVMPTPSMPATRPLIAIHRHGEGDDVRLDLPQRLVTEAEAVHRTGGEIIADDIGLLHQAADEVAAFFRLQIERQAFLAAVARREIAAAVGTIDAVLERAADAHRIRAGHAFDLDDLGAEIGEDFRAERAGAGPGQVAEADAAQEVRAHRLSLSAAHRYAPRAPGPGPSATRAATGGRARREKPSRRA